MGRAFGLYPPRLCDPSKVHLSLTCAWLSCRPKRQSKQSIHSMRKFLVPYARIRIVALALVLALFIAPAVAEAKAGGGSSMGSKGSYTYKPSIAAPITRSVTPPPAAVPAPLGFFSGIPSLAACWEGLPAPVSALCCSAAICSAAASAECSVSSFKSG